MGLLVLQKCLEKLQDELSSQQFNTWIRPLQPRLEESNLMLLAPNQYVRERIEQQFLERIQDLMGVVGDPISPIQVQVEVGNRERLAGVPLRADDGERLNEQRRRDGLIGSFTFDAFYHVPGSGCG